MTGTKVWHALGDGYDLLVDVNQTRPGSGPLPSALTPLTRTYLVDAGFGAASPSGSIGAPFASIATGVAGLEAAGADVGGTLLVVPGTYALTTIAAEGTWSIRGLSAPGGAAVILPALEFSGVAPVVALENCTIGDLTIAELGAPGATLTNVNVTGTLTSNAVGGGPHENQPWRFRNCTFEPGAGFVTAGGVSFDVFMDDASIRSFYAAGGTTAGNVTFYQEATVNPVTVFASAGTNTVASSAAANFLPVTGNAFTMVGGNPFTLTPEGCILNYLTAYAGPAPNPATPRVLIKVTVTASLTNATAAAGVALAGIDLGGDLIGQPLIANFAGGAQDLQLRANQEPDVVTVHRVIDLAAASAQTFQPCFGSLDGIDLVISRLNLVVQAATLIDRAW